MASTATCPWACHKQAMERNAPMDEQLMQIMQARVNTYQLLSRFYFKEVDITFYQDLLAMDFPTNTGNETVDKGYGTIRNYLSAPHPGVMTELAVDYARTFIGHGNNGYSAAYPFESVYTSAKRLLMQGARDEVLVLYRAAGLEKKDSWKDGEDHIALELEFMQILAQRTVDALADDNEDEAYALLLRQQSFLEDHLLGWFPMMESDMKKFAKTDFYRGLADLTRGFLETDLELINELVSEDSE